MIPPSARRCRRHEKSASVVRSPITASGTDIGWALLSAHALVLLCIFRRSDIELAEIARMVGMTEGSADNLVTDLLDSGVISRESAGRGNVFTVHLDAPFGGSFPGTVGDLLRAVG